MVNLLGLSYVIQKDLLWSKAWNTNEFKSGRSASRPTPHQSSIDALNTTTPNLADLLADLPLAIEHRCLEILLHQTWQIYWQIFPPQLSIDALNTATPNLGDPLCRSTLNQSSIDALNTTTPNLADLLADLPPSIEDRCLEYHYTKLGKSTGRSGPSPPIKQRCLENHYTK